MADPIRRDPSGALRVGKSRVLLELLVRAFEDGLTPEAIVGRYSTLTLAETYAAIAYYLGHRDEVNRYMAGREVLAEEVHQRIEGHQGDLAEMRARLKSQRNP
jgi:uncharacterized protein (DUF433 family)